MLEAKDSAQLEQIAKILGEDIREWVVGEYPIRTLYLERPISFDEMQAMVDYLKRVNDELVLPKMCAVSLENGITTLDLTRVPADEVMQLCKDLERVKGRTYGFWLDSYEKHGMIRF